MEPQNKCVTIVSGGMDSVTLAYYLKDAGYDQTTLSFNYGQRHSRELISAGACLVLMKHDHLRHHMIDISNIGKVLGGSSLTENGIAVPEGHYAKDNMKKTVVPNRNAIMLSIAYGVAVAEGAVVLAYGAHAGDHFVYPDCRPEFIDALEVALQLGNEGFGNPELKLFAPFKTWTKADIVKWGLEHNVPYECTWTCYNGNVKACGRCGTCVERLEAFNRCGAVDPLDYEDRNYWKQAITEFEEQHG